MYFSTNKERRKDMRAILEFNLPEEQEEFELANKGPSYSIALYDLDMFLRSKIKYPPDTVTDQELAIYEEIRSKLHEIANDHQVKVN